MNLQSLSPPDLRITKLSRCMTLLGLLAGWTCCNCKIFNGSGKVAHLFCRHCGHKRCDVD